MKCTGTHFWQEDYSFLVGQRLFPQIGSMGCVDTLTATRQKKRLCTVSRNVKQTVQIEICDESIDSDEEG